jgi:hypothetical protein
MEIFTIARTAEGIYFILRVFPKNNSSRYPNPFGLDGKPENEEELFCMKKKAR